MKKGFILFVLAGLLSLTTYGQSMSSEERSVNDYSAISVSKGIDVILTNKSTSSGKIRIESNHQEVFSKVKTSVDKNTLNITFESKSGNNYKNLKLKVYVPADGINQITASSGSDVNSQERLTFKDLEVSISSGSDLELDLKADMITISMSGGSDAKLKGSTNHLKVKASGGSDLMTSGLKAKNADISMSGGSDADIYVTGTLNATLSGGSDLRYTGNPSDKNISADKSSDVKAK
ncbi:MAG: DUF2807 domain-containing protein [Tannerella sp.]|jgi:hypothetical protein|nr:DUF2807 domain-containing protein [Tannerella sp.]